MAVSVKAGTFSTTTGAGPVDVNDVGFQPKAVILFSALRTADGSGASDWNFVGSFSANDDRAVCSFSEDGAATANVSNGRHVASSVVAPDQAGGTTWDGEAQLTFDADGFNVTISNQFGADYDFIYLALGGADVEAATGQFNIPTVTGPTTDIVTGLSFQPTCVLFLGASTSGSGTGLSADSGLALGCATGTADAANWTITYSSDEAATSDTKGYGRTGEAHAMAAPGPGGIVTRFLLDQFTSDGFEIDVLEAAPIGTAYAHYLALGGAAVYEAGKFDEPTTGAATDVTLSGDITPRAVLIASTLRAESTADTATDDACLSVGVATSPTARYSVGGTDDDGEATSETWSFQASDAVGIAGDLADGIASKMDISTLGDDTYQKFAVVMDTAQAGNTRDWFYLVFGDAGEIHQASASATLAVTETVDQSEVTHVAIPSAATLAVTETVDQSEVTHAATASATLAITTSVAAEVAHIAAPSSATLAVTISVDSTVEHLGVPSAATLAVTETVDQSEVTHAATASGTLAITADADSEVTHEGDAAGTLAITETLDQSEVTHVATPSAATLAITGQAAGVLEGDVIGVPSPATLAVTADAASTVEHIGAPSAATLAITAASVPGGVVRLGTASATLAVTVQAAAVMTYGGSGSGTLAITSSTDSDVAHVASGSATLAITGQASGLLAVSLILGPLRATWGQPTRVAKWDQPNRVATWEDQ